MRKLPEWMTGGGYTQPMVWKVSVHHGREIGAEQFTSWLTKVERKTGKV